MVEWPQAVLLRITGGVNGRTKEKPLEKESRVLPEKQDKAFGEFYKSARYNKILDKKTTLLIHLATAMSAACYP